jgi:Acetylornithine deacetylase/Succinyl-diaminopimelate desuccinylase and related deacylases
MIFVPSKEGLSHNPAEFTSLEEVSAGANVLLHLMVDAAEECR